MNKSYNKTANLEIRFKYIFGLISLTFLFYIFENNLRYHTPDYNIVIIPLWLSMVALGLCSIFMNKYKYFLSIIATSLAAILAVFFIGKSGGFQAPGIVWMISILAFPIVVLGNKIGGILSALTASSSYYFFVFDKITDHKVYDYFLENNVLERERIINIILFGLFSVGLVITLIYANEKNIKEIERAKSHNDNLLRILVHDIASPIFLIKNMTKRLARNKVDSQTNYLNKMNHAILMLEEQLNQVRQMKALEDGKLGLNIDDCDIVELTKNAISILEVKAQEKNISIELITDLDTCLLSIDPVVFKNQIISNLLTNAIKFSFEGTIIKIEMKSVLDKVTISVADQGMGIPQDLILLLFDVNAKTSRPGTGGEKGTGFGLPLVKNFVIELEGDIKVHSVEKDKEDPLSTREHGTVFTLSFDKSA